MLCLKKIANSLPYVLLLLLATTTQILAADGDAYTAKGPCGLNASLTAKGAVLSINRILAGLAAEITTSSPAAASANTTGLPPSQAVTNQPIDSSLIPKSGTLKLQLISLQQFINYTNQSVVPQKLYSMNDCTFNPVSTADSTSPRFSCSIENFTVDVTLYLLAKSDPLSCVSKINIGVNNWIWCQSCNQSDGSTSSLELVIQLSIQPDKEIKFIPNTNPVNVTSYRLGFDSASIQFGNGFTEKYLNQTAAGQTQPSLSYIKPSQASVATVVMRFKHQLLTTVNSSVAYQLILDPGREAGLDPSKYNIISGSVSRRASFACVFFFLVVFKISAFMQE